MKHQKDPCPDFILIKLNVKVKGHFKLHPNHSLPKWWCATTAVIVESMSTGRRILAKNSSGSLPIYNFKINLKYPRVIIKPDIE